jgi:hypothetical protein
MLGLDEPGVFTTVSKKLEDRVYKFSQLNCVKKVNHAPLFRFDTLRRFPNIFLAVEIRMQVTDHHNEMRQTRVHTHISYKFCCLNSYRCSLRR